MTITSVILCVCSATVQVGKGTYVAQEGKVAIRAACQEHKSSCRDIQESLRVWCFTDSDPIAVLCQWVGG